jgi:hypothetical protein
MWHDSIIEKCNSRTFSASTNLREKERPHVKRKKVHKKPTNINHEVATGYYTCTLFSCFTQLTGRIQVAIHALQVPANGFYQAPVDGILGLFFQEGSQGPSRATPNNNLIQEPTFSLYIKKWVASAQTCGRAVTRALFKTRRYLLLPHVIILQLQTLQLTHITSDPRNFPCDWFSGYFTNSSLAVCLEPRCPGLHGSLSSCPVMTARESINTRRAHALQVRLFWCHEERT